MSIVLARYQGISEMVFYRTAKDLRKELSELLMRDKVAPKKWRHNVTYRALDHIEDMMEPMHEVNKIYPYNPELVKERKRLQGECIKHCDALWEILQGAMDTCWKQKLNAVNQEGQPTQERLALEKHLTDTIKIKRRKGYSYGRTGTDDSFGKTDRAA